MTHAPVIVSNRLEVIHAVKLRRYQDLIDEHISKMNWNVLNMLNTKYIVTQRGVIPNPDAMGNAWFVNDVQFVPTPDDESAALNTLDLHKQLSQTRNSAKF